MYNEKQVNFLKRNAPHFCLPELTDAFNNTFSKSKSKDAIKLACRYRGIKIKPEIHEYTQEELDWLIDKYLNERMSTNEIIADFNKKFGAHISAESFRKSMEHRGIKKAINRGQFGQGINDRIGFPIGSIMKDVYYDGHLYKRIKVGKQKYMFLHRYIYEQHYGPLKKGEIIIFKDGNENNLDISNLIKIDTSINGSLSLASAHGLGSVTEAFIECKRLEKDIQQFKKEKKLC